MPRTALLALALVAAAAHAADAVSTPPPEGQTSSVIGGLTVGQGKNLVAGEVGWPGLHVSYLRGVASNLDIGVRISFDYGVQGLVSQVSPGLGVSGLVRFRLLQSGIVSLSAVFEPGPFFWIDRFGYAWAGFAVPLGVRLGIAASSALLIGLSFDVPLWVQFGPIGGLNVPFLTGLGVEYFVKSDLSVFFKTRMGPALRPSQRAEFAFDGLVGVGWRF
jgi:hypothetical protein